jgi:hypothetical protein
MSVAVLAKGAATYSTHLGKTFGAVANFIKNGFGHSVTGATRTLLTSGKNADDYFESLTDKNWTGMKALGSAALISIPTALTNLTNFFSDNRRLKELAAGSSNFHTSREAATNTLKLSTLGLAGSATLGISGAVLGTAASIGKAGSPLGVALTVGSGVLATGCLAFRQVYKWANMDLPFSPNGGLGLLGLNSALFRVDDPSSPYYMLNQNLEKTIQKRKLEDEQYGKSAEGYFDFMRNTSSQLMNTISA